MEIVEERIFGNLKILYKKKSDGTFIGCIYHKGKKLIETSPAKQLYLCKREAENYAFDLNCTIESEKNK